MRKKILRNQNNEPDLKMRLIFVDAAINLDKFIYDLVKKGTPQTYPIHTFTDLFTK